jgi:hypothetical protein
MALRKWFTIRPLAKARHYGFGTPDTVEREIDFSTSHFPMARGVTRYCVFELHSAIDIDFGVRAGRKSVVVS